MIMIIIQSVLAPGFFTMASNVVTSSFKDIHPEMARWFIVIIVMIMVIIKRNVVTSSFKDIHPEMATLMFNVLDEDEVDDNCTHDNDDHNGEQRGDQQLQGHPSRDGQGAYCHHHCHHRDDDDCDDHGDHHK